MAFDERYRKQVALLLRAIPVIAPETCFALKGGTAINLFVRDLPRLSVDIDLTYLTILPRARSLGAIDKAMKRIEARLGRLIKGARITRKITEDTVTRLIVREDRTQIKIETTPVLRGCVYPPRVMPVCASIEDMFGFAEMRIVSNADLYAGKIMAGLDRQNPRDLFDIRDLLANEGIDDDLRAAFLVYLMSHGRPMSEVLAAKPKDIAREFEVNFQGMTKETVDLEELLGARDAIITAMISDMPDHHRQFLVDFESGAPDWSKLSVPHAAKLPAIKWRQENFDKLPAGKRAANVKKLADVLGVAVNSAGLGKPIK